MSELTIGNKVPDFDIPRDGGGNVHLAAYAGKPVVLYFYPKDDTTGCTAEAVAFTALMPEFEKVGAVVIGISPDPARKHDKFIQKHSLAVILGSDEDNAVAEAYGVWKEKSMYGRSYMGIERTTFLIGADGALAEIWPKVKVAGHADAVLTRVQALMA